MGLGARDPPFPGVDARLEEGEIWLVSVADLSVIALFADQKHHVEELLQAADVSPS
jgi:hypothetical protein